MTQPKQSCLIQSCQQENCLPHCPCDCHSVKQSWEERFIKLNTEQEQSTRQILDFFSAELLRIKTELLEELEKEKQDATYPKGGDFIENMEPKLQSVLNEVFNQALIKAKEIVERNLL